MGMLYVMDEPSIGTHPRDSSAYELPKIKRGAHNLYILDESNTNKTEILEGSEP